MITAYQQRSKTKLITLVIAIVVVAGAVLLLDHFKSHSAAGYTAASTTPQTNTNSSVTTPAPTSSTATSATYKDGSYSSTIDYNVPHGQEEIRVNLTLSGGSVSAVSIQNSESDGDSAQYQEDFASVYKNYVVGKKLSSIQLSGVAGASDTTQAFNDALSQIGAKAQA